MPLDEMKGLEPICWRVRQRTGVDLGNYRAASVWRRLSVRMSAVGAQSVDDYVALLDAQEREAARLLDCLTIKVSAFYRNPIAFEFVRRHVIAGFRDLGRPARLWSVGCARGEEAYSLAMLLEDAGIDGTVLATDVDAQALAGAAEATFGIEAIESLPQRLRQRFVVDLAQGRVQVAPAVRARVRFLRHDLTQALPGATAGRLDLVCCRNVLIYLTRAVQEAAQLRLRQAVRNGGSLWLGEAEWPLPRVARGLTVLDSGARVFGVGASVGDARH